MLLLAIPARYASSRFPGKPLVDIGGESMIQRVYRQALASKVADKIIVATDDHRIFDHVQTFGGEAMMTSPNHQSGTDRCAEVARAYPAADFVINIQGDEPFIDPRQIRQLADLIRKGGLAFPIATLAKKITEPEQITNPNVVKVVYSQNGSALYFSRNPIPFIRGENPYKWIDHNIHHKHIGIYAYRRATLMRIAELAPTPMELAESLEQLRWLDHGVSIRVGETPYDSFGIDTPEDVEFLEKRGFKPPRRN